MNITPQDQDNEKAVAAVVGTRWKCKAVPFGTFCHIDWGFWRDGTIYAIGELKCRKMPSAKHPTVFLSRNKYTHLMAGSKCLGIPAFYIIQFTDGIRYINVAKVDPTKIEVTGRRDRGLPTDIEPIIHVPISNMEEL